MSALSATSANGRCRITPAGHSVSMSERLGQRWHLSGSPRISLDDLLESPALPELLEVSLTTSQRLAMRPDLTAATVTAYYDRRRQALRHRGFDPESRAVSDVFAHALRIAMRDAGLS